MRVIRNLSEILGQKQAINLLQGALKRGCLAHSYLFTGPKGVGKETTAKALLYHLFCHLSKESPCGSCLACKKLDRGIHPDLMVIYPEKRDIRIDSIREIERFLRYRPLEAPYRVVLILEADKLNLEAGNALLKSLEEPPLYALFLLLTERASQILPTILSRTQIVRFIPLPREIIKNYLMVWRGFEEAVAETLAELSLGSLGRALEIADSGLLEELNSFVKAATNPKEEVKFKVAEKLARLNKESLDLFLFLLTLWIWKSYLKERINFPFPKALPEESLKGNPHFLIREVAQAKKALEYYLNPELTLYVLMKKIESASKS